MHTQIGRATETANKTHGKHLFVTLYLNRSNEKKHQLHWQKVHSARSSLPRMEALLGDWISSKKNALSPSINRSKRYGHRHTCKGRQRWSVYVEVWWMYNIKRLSNIENKKYFVLRLCVGFYVWPFFACCVRSEFQKSKFNYMIRDMCAQPMSHLDQQSNEPK